MTIPKLPIYPSEKNPTIIKEIQSHLRHHGYKNIIIDGIFGRQTLFAVRAFQSSNLDTNDVPLYVDGIVGINTWEALSREIQQLKITPPSPLQTLAIKYATQEIGATEVPLGSNRGPKVEEYLKSVSCPPGSPWCAAFVYWCFLQASYQICTINPLVETAGCLTHWNKSQGLRITPQMAIQSPHLIKLGSIFIINYGKGKGHTGIVKEVRDNTISTIEGNTNNNHSREGYGVFNQIRKISNINTGFINYG